MAEDRKVTLVWAGLLVVTIGVWALAIDAADLAIVWTIHEAANLFG